MSSIAICDFDGIIADNAEHTNIAQQRAKAFVLQQASGLDREAERKDSDESTIKTAAWKAQVVASFAEQYHTILFIDDDEKNRNAVASVAANLKHVDISIKSCFEECFSNPIRHHKTTKVLTLMKPYLLHIKCCILSHIFYSVNKCSL